MPSYLRGQETVRWVEGVISHVLAPASSIVPQDWRCSCDAYNDGSAVIIWLLCDRLKASSQCKQAHRLTFRSG